jgi:hypothetical protein
MCIFFHVFYPGFVKILCSVCATVVLYIMCIKTVLSNRMFESVLVLWTALAGFPHGTGVLNVLFLSDSIKSER